MHKQFMLAALEQAWLGRGKCAPNPSVGAVIVENKQITARGWHQGAGTAHAEQHALDQLTVINSEAVLYATLEPCNHWGRTPPCVLAIINAKMIKRVYFAFKDPNPVVAANDTTAILEKAGIEVIHYPLPEINDFYRSYYYWTVTKKPWVTAKIAQSFDGKIAGLHGKKILLSNEKCAQFTHKQRLYTDVILTTAKTVNQDDPLLNARVENLSMSKHIAIIDSRLTLNSAAKILTTAQHLHIYHAKGKLVKQPLPNCTYHAVTAIEGLINLAEVVSHLGSLGFHDCWVEAGGRLFTALHQQGLVQQSYFYLVPAILGTEATNAYGEENFFSKKHTVSWLAENDNMIACVNWQEAACLPE